jgi:uncharacterized membrane protein (DUF2068 family)
MRHELALLLSAVTLALPGSVLEPMWLLNPRAHQRLVSAGAWAIALMLAVSVACATACVGVWRLRRWGHVTAVIVLCVNMIGDATSAMLGLEPRAIIGVPIVLAVLAYLARPRVRALFTR